MAKEDRSINLQPFDEQAQTYLLYALCRNCDWTGEVPIPKGTPVAKGDPITVPGVVCVACGCAELVRPAVPPQGPAAAPVAQPQPVAITQSRYQQLLDLYRAAQEERNQRPWVNQPMLDPNHPHRRELAGYEAERGRITARLSPPSLGTSMGTSMGGHVGEGSVLEWRQAASEALAERARRTASPAGSPSADQVSHTPMEVTELRSAEELAQAVLNGTPAVVGGIHGCSGFPQPPAAAHAAPEGQSAAQAGQTARPGSGPTLADLGQYLRVENGLVYFRHAWGHMYAYRPETLAGLGINRIPIGPNSYYDVGERREIHLTPPNANGDMFDMASYREAMRGGRWSHSMLPPPVSAPPETFFGVPVGEVDFDAIVANHTDRNTQLARLDASVRELEERLSFTEPITVAEALNHAEAVIATNDQYREQINRVIQRIWPTAVREFAENSLASEPLARNDTPAGTPSADVPEQPK